MKKGFTLISKACERGFTLIELLVVITIIGILMAISIFGIASARAVARDAKRKADLEMIRSGLEMYKADCNVYPDILPESGSLVGIGDESLSSCAEDNVYLEKVPQDPLSPNRKYSYNQSSAFVYELCASLEQGGETDETFPCGDGCGEACNYRVTNP
jgi:general secretion pathway protein G